ncbi:SGNH/GDSL hydrolase family protein [Vibrio sp. CAU 1672]|uniref:SGNH/GDSL hydrolase family protein n=1 Tax=Vibrio sp. CAU 1672 TaxID=3032594 RepID=UPI0023DCE49F|nr:SGNH/GDSL hydrolase family protein [Vibrio sp. CAU 1672]MDF2154419.1 SGNH/GDSL hydrolase family protein [Vibrio sp. CAU 1672]
MNAEQLLKELKENHCLDLVKIYQANPGCHFYDLIEQLYHLRQQHGLSTRISPLVTEIESLTSSLNRDDITREQFDHLAYTLDFNQRTHKMSRYIQATDNHTTFAQQVDVVMFGDSITEWGPWHDALPFLTLANRGLAGDTTAGMRQRLSTTKVCKPKLVCVMAGINDLAQGRCVDDIFNDYQELIHYWRSHDISVWVQSTLYVGKRLATLNPQVAQLNQKLHELCEQQAIRFIDLNQTLCPQGCLPLECSCDDLHLNSYAYGQWLKVLVPLLKQRFS